MRIAAKAARDGNSVFGLSVASWILPGHGFCGIQKKVEN